MGTIVTATRTRRWLPAALMAVGLLAVLALCLNLAGCFSDIPTGHRFESFEVTQNGQAVPWSTASPAYLRFEFPKRIHGSGGCNAFEGKVDNQDGRLVTSDLTFSLGLCSDSLAAQDRWFNELIGSKPKWQLKDDVITLTGDDGRQMKLRRTT